MVERNQIIYKKNGEEEKEQEEERGGYYRNWKLQVTSVVGAVADTTGDLTK